MMTTVWNLKRQIHKEDQKNNQIVQNTESTVTFKLVLFVNILEQKLASFFTLLTQLSRISILSFPFFTQCSSYFCNSISPIHDELVKQIKSSDCGLLNWIVGTETIWSVGLSVTIITIRIRTHINWRRSHSNIQSAVFFGGLLMIRQIESLHRRHLGFEETDFSWKPYCGWLL